MSDGHDDNNRHAADDAPKQATPDFSIDADAESSSITLEQSFEAARSIMQTQAVSFYQAFKRLPEDRFQAVTAVYAFCRYADDLVDEGGSAVLPKLDDLEASVRTLFESAPFRGTPMSTDGNNVHSDSQDDSPNRKSPSALIAPTLAWWPAFVASVQRYGVQKRGLLMQIQGQRMDADFHDITSTHELIEYSRLVAASVGIVLVPILVNDRHALLDADFIEACEKLGIAMQITNILRDVGEDIRERNRVYIPHDLLESYGITRDLLVSLAHGRNDAQPEAIPEAFVSLWERLATLADQYYLPYERYIDHFHKSARMPLIVAAKLYQAIEQAVRDQSYDCFTRRCYTSKATRLRIVSEIQLREKASWKI
ncbi:phytoene/squalene synthase family protein [Bifidobacterium aquikefiricola]|uniref:Phytoene/squalene synthase family protein n=1 Tax=Bifidobacterium aquikefiricola TaxID=3059038 RepID=A0AB39U7U4_9BIFI